MTKYHFPILFFLLLPFIHGYFEFSNIKCDVVDADFTAFEYCYIKSANRSYKYMSLKVNLFKLPIDNVTIGVELQKKTNGYNPFLYNFSFDGCKFQKNPSGLVQKFFYSFLMKHTNMNHTCPYDHDLIVEKLDIEIANNQLSQVLPWPEGQFCLITKWSAYNKLRAVVSVYFKLT